MSDRKNECEVENSSTNFHCSRSFD